LTVRLESRTRDQGRGLRDQLRNVVKPVGSRSQIEDGGDSTEIELAIKMRKQLVIARELAAQGVAERIGIDRDQEQPGLAEVMLSRGLRHLSRGGEMNEPVAGVIRAAAE